MKKLTSYCQDLEVAIKSKAAKQKNTEQRLAPLHEREIMVCIIHIGVHVCDHITLLEYSNANIIWKTNAYMLVGMPLRYLIWDV